MTLPGRWKKVYRGRQDRTSLGWTETYSIEVPSTVVTVRKL